MASPDAPPVVNADANPNGCIAEVTLPGLGHHNTGLTCITAACHGLPLGLEAPQYSIAGTLYSDAAGTLPVPGATILVVDANGVAATLVTGIDGPLGGAGNFYSENLALVPPFTVQATQCPAIQQMPDPAADGNCNSCHTPGGAANTRIHL